MKSAQELSFTCVSSVLIIVLENYTQEHYSLSYSTWIELESLTLDVKSVLTLHVNNLKKRLNQTHLECINAPAFIL